MERQATPVEPNLDPRLQQMADRQRRGLHPAATASTEEGEIAVVAKVADREAWEALSEVRLGADLGGGPEIGGYIVTGRIPVSRLEHVRQHVISLKAAQGVKPTLIDTLKETEASRELLGIDCRGEQGRGVVVGVIDFGGDFAHRNFRDSEGKTRLLALWDQHGVATATGPVKYGRAYSRDEIDHALQADDPYDALGYAPEPKPEGTHGTHVLDIAAGNGVGSGAPGVAPNADIVFVELASSDIPWQESGVVDKFFGDSVQLLEAVAFVFEIAGDRPCVVNLSLGTNGGPHDGTSLVEQGLDALVTGKPNRAVVIAAANSFADGIHAAGAVASGGAVDLGWTVPAGDFSHNELEIWYGGADEFSVELIDPDGTSVATVALGDNARIVNEGKTVVFVAHRRKDPNNGDNVIGIFLESGIPSGQWTVRLHGIEVTAGAFHAWIERDDDNQSSFAEPHDNNYTLGSISCGRHSIAVGSYDAHKKTLPLSWFSSSGPTRDERQKPEISAPGHDVVAAHSRTGVGVIRKSGTSMAAPAVAGIVALMLAEAKARDRLLPADEIRDILVATARGGEGWNKRRGNGRVHARRAVAAVAAM